MKPRAHNTCNQGFDNTCSSAQGPTKRGAQGSTMRKPSTLCEFYNHQLCHFYSCSCSLLILHHRCLFPAALFSTKYVCIYTALQACITNVIVGLNLSVFNKIISPNTHCPRNFFLSQKMFSSRHCEITYGRLYIPEQIDKTYTLKNPVSHVIVVNTHWEPDWWYGVGALLWDTPCVA